MANDTISLSDLQERMKAVEAEFLQAEEAVRQAQERREKLRTALQVIEEMLDGQQSPDAPPAAARATPRKRSRRSSPKRTKGPSAAERAIKELEAHGDF